jgi:choline dehydrogenase-like flavoprotein
VTLDPKVKDHWGLPALRVTTKNHPDDLKTMQFFQDREVEILEAAGARKIWRSTIQDNYLGYHLLGTCRMGNDPVTSVVNPDHRTHDVPNLFLCDGSSFVTSGRNQPTLTIQALAYRAADRITHLAKTGTLGS